MRASLQKFCFKNYNYKTLSQNMEQLACSAITDQHGGIIVNCPAHPMVTSSGWQFWHRCTKFSQYSERRPLIWPCWKCPHAFAFSAKSFYIDVKTVNTGHESFPANIHIAGGTMASLQRPCSTFIVASLHSNECSIIAEQNSINFKHTIRQIYVHTYVVHP